MERQQEQKLKKHHSIITGIGRSGTTLLVKLLTQLGLDTGYAIETMEEHIYDNCNAGLEQSLLKPNAPYIVKDTWICNYIDEIVQSRDLVIDHAFIPIRNLSEAAKSRIHVTQNTNRATLPNPKTLIIPGGMWHTNIPEEQENILANLQFTLLVGLAKLNCPITFIHYPKLTRNPRYLFRKLRPILKEIKFNTFEKAFQQIVQKDLVHKYKND